MFNDLIFTFAVISICIVLGKFFPIQKQNFQRHELNYDLGIFVINDVFLSMALATITVFTLDTLKIPAFSLNLHGAHLSIQFVVFLLLIDFFSYWVHRFAHTFSSLWEIHKLHHGVTYMNPMATFRHSLLWQLYNYMFMGVVGSLLSVDTEIKLTVILITMTVDIFQHSNVSLRLPYFFNYIMILPRNHNFHHAKKNYLSKGQNYGLVFSFWDIIFKSFYLPKTGDVEFGLIGEQLPKGQIKKYLYPISSKKE